MRARPCGSPSLARGRRRQAAVLGGTDHGRTPTSRLNSGFPSDLGDLLALCNAVGPRGHVTTWAARRGCDSLVHITVDEAGWASALAGRSAGRPTGSQCGDRSRGVTPTREPGYPGGRMAGRGPRCHRGVDHAAAPWSARQDGDSPPGWRMPGRRGRAGPGVVTGGAGHRRAARRAGVRCGILGLPLTGLVAAVLPAVASSSGASLCDGRRWVTRSAAYSAAGSATRQPSGGWTWEPCAPHAQQRD